MYVQYEIYLMGMVIFLNLSIQHMDYFDIFFSEFLIQDRLKIVYFSSIQTCRRRRLRRPENRFSNFINLLPILHQTIPQPPPSLREEYHCQSLCSPIHWNHKRSSPTQKRPNCPYERLATNGDCKSVRKETSSDYPRTVGKCPLLVGGQAQIGITGVRP